MSQPIKNVTGTFGQQSQKTTSQQTSSKQTSQSSSSKQSSMKISKKTGAGLSLLFRRANEPVFASRNGINAFAVPQNFLSNRFQNLSQSSSAFQEMKNRVHNRIQLIDITPPNIDFALQIPRDGGFSLFNEKHKSIAGQLITLFMSYENSEELMSAAAFAKDRVNPYLFQYALSVATNHREDTRDLDVPSVVQTFPDQFVDPIVFNRIRQEAAIADESQRQAVVIPVNFTANELEEEQRLAYFREDIGVNSHHWHWHLVYPGAGPERIVNKDRRGELFFYMHNQLIARYNIERMSNNMKRVARLNNLREIIPEGYFPKIIRSSNNRAYPPRISNCRLLDINRDGAVVEVGDLERWRDRIYEAIDSGFATSTTGERIPMTIDLLGDIVEASDRNPNPNLYGSLHNQGHNVISFVHDPDARHMEEFAVMGDVTTAMRDPIFYRWHSFIDAIFLRYKNTLSPYNDQQLSYQGVKVESITTELARGKNPARNTLLTFWQRSQVDLAAGLDFGPQGNVFATFTHLQHADFNYRIMVNNSGAQRQGTCRIFMAPRKDERGQAIAFREQRTLLIEMDKFIVNLKPGANTILRRSSESSVTIPFDRTFRSIGAANQPTDSEELAQFQFCGCGWPHHMLVPHGTAQGMELDLFVMISNFADDAIANLKYNENEGCNDSASFCGIRDSLYPDRRSMGYPFDRNNSATSLTAFMNNKTNMATQQISIRYSNTIVNRPQ